LDQAHPALDVHLQSESPLRLVADPGVKEKNVMTRRTDATRYAMKPSRWVLFWRTFFPYQLYRFAWINLRMLRMIFKSHEG